MTHPIRLIATDLDGTLLRTDKTISDRTMRALERCRAQGIKVVFATARPKRAVTDILEQIPADAVILHNGAEVWADGQLLMRIGIEASVARGILLGMRRDDPGRRLSIEMDDTLYANFDPSSLWKGVVFTHSDFTDLPDKPADKILVGITNNDEITLLARYLPKELYIQNSEGIVGMIMRREATKWNAIQHVATHLGIPTTAVAVFGDDYNDVEMLRNCGAGVAMANAQPDVKTVANHICPSNDEDGLAVWIEENLL